jgi:hypothetical protein
LLSSKLFNSAGVHGMGCFQLLIELEILRQQMAICQSTCTSIR